MVGHGTAGRAAATLTGVLDIVYTAILVGVFAFVAWFAGYVVYRLHAGRR